ncbi:MAG: type III PLP-dependent enzyme [Pseudobdellovibrionaceae bacterium]
MTHFPPTFSADSTASPLRVQERALGRQAFVDEVALRLLPSQPLHILYPDQLALNAKRFRRLFRGTVMYAVKCNPHKDVIRALARAGIRTFDVASIEEVRLVRKLVPTARLHFMHTVKSREAIREAYFKHGVRVFVVDTVDELHKVVGETNLAPDLELYVRMAPPKNETASTDFSSKFGARPDEAVGLLRETRLVAHKLGLMFHVGTQSRSPEPYRRAIAIAAQVIREAGVEVNCLDVGGGFPAGYVDESIPPLEEFMGVIHSTIDDYGLGDLQLYCEPGRALVADAGSLVVRVELRKKDALYINDGVYGALIETIDAQGSLKYPVRRIGGVVASGERAYRLFGPTCDSYDAMKGPFMLPDDVVEGDYLEIGLTGAYGVACRTNFNGFGGHKTVLMPPNA